MTHHANVNLVTFTPALMARLQDNWSSKCNQVNFNVNRCFTGKILAIFNSVSQCALCSGVTPIFRLDQDMINRWTISWQVVLSCKALFTKISVGTSNKCCCPLAVRVRRPVYSHQKGLLHEPTAQALVKVYGDHCYRTHFYFSWTAGKLCGVAVSKLCKTRNAFS